MIYVTHDQTEALTFADQVVVMNEGEVVQTGTPVDLFERPAPHLRRPLHRLAGHERPALRGRATASPASPAMPVATANARRRRRRQAHASSACGPSSSRFADDGIPVEVVRVADVGRHRIVEARAGDSRINALLSPRTRAVPPGPAHLAFDAGADADLRRRLARAEDAAHEDRQPEGLVVRAAGRAAGRLQRASCR